MVNKMKRQLEILKKWKDYLNDVKKYKYIIISKNFFPKIYKLLVHIKTPFKKSPRIVPKTLYLNGFGEIGLQISRSNSD